MELNLFGLRPFLIRKTIGEELWREEIEIMLKDIMIFLFLARELLSLINSVIEEERQ